MLRIKNTRQIMEVMQAYLDGKKIESRPLYAVSHFITGNEGSWAVNKTPSWDWYTCDYRVKPEPREYFVVLDSAGTPIGAGKKGGAATLQMKGSFAGVTAVAVREVV